MTSTGKVLFTLRIDPELRDQYKELCASEGSSASADLLQFVKWRLAGNSLAGIDADTDGHIDKSWGDIERYIASHLDDCLYSHLDKYLDENLKDKLDAYIDIHLGKEVEERVSRHIDYKLDAYLSKK